MATPLAKNKDVPKLRFSEFTKAWKPAKIGDHLEIGSGRDYKHLKKGTIPVFGTGGIMTYVDEYLYDGTSIGIGRKGTIDKPFILQGKFWTVDTLFYTHSFKQTTPEFVFAIFQNINWKRHNEASGVPSLSKKTIEAINAFFPSTPEQEKISEFLKVVDERIAQLTTKKDLITQYSKSMMQKLFSGGIRFKDNNGNDFPDWEKKQLGDIGARCIKKNTGFTHNTVLTNSATKGVVYQADYFDNEIAKSSKLDGYYVVYTGNFVYNPRISATAPVGPIKRNNLGTGVMSPLYTIFSLPEEYANFFEHYFNSTLWHKYMKSVANFGARHDRMAISAKDFLAMPLPYPSPLEQVKITFALTVINKKIELASRELTQTKAFKAALLQQMFV